jgi:hypothetical protein
MVNNMLQDNINTLAHQIVSMAGPDTPGSPQRTMSIDSKRTVDHMRRENHPHLPPRPVYESIYEVEETPSSHGQSAASADLDLEAGRDEKRKRPTILINTCTVGLTIALVLTLVGLGCQQMAQEFGTDRSWHRLLLLLTAPLQIFVSLVSLTCQFVNIPSQTGKADPVNHHGWIASCLGSCSSRYISPY